MAGSIEGDGTADWMFGLGSGCLEGDAAAMIHVISVKNLIGPIPTTRGTFVELSDASRGVRLRAKRTQASRRRKGVGRQ